MEKKGAKKSGLECVQKESVLQAVVIADNFNDTFCPLTSNSAQCLLPLVNRPLLDYTLQCLSYARVQEVILFCSAYADQIKDFVRNNNSWGRMQVTVVVSESCRSLGDAMRDLDAKSIIRGDFILVTGNVIGSLKIMEALEKHKKHVAVDKCAAMTLIYKECGKRVRSPSEQICLVTDARTNRVLCFSKNSTDKKLNIPLELLMESSEVDIRSDLMETGVSVCTVAVPPLFSDNFDFQSVDDFVRSLLINDEIMESTLYAYCLPGEQYAASVTSWKTYHGVSHDIMHRWSYPQVPDASPEDCYSYKLNNVYVQQGISLAKGCQVIEDVVIAKGSSIGEGTTLTTAVVGKNCKIARDVVIRESHLFDNVTIEEKCTLEYCILGEGCIVRSGSKLRDCVLGPHVIIPPDKSLSSTRIQASPHSEGGEEHQVGEKAHIYVDDSEFDSDSDSELGEEGRGGAWRGICPEEHVSSSESEAETASMSSGRASVLQEDTHLFYTEVLDSLTRGRDEGIPCDNLVLEVNSSRYAYNVTVREVSYHVTRAIVSLSLPSPGAHLNYFLPLLANYIRNSEAMADALSAIEDEAEKESQMLNALVKILHFLYEKDILSEEALLSWHSKPREETPFSALIRKQVMPFIKWLQEADEETSSDDEKN